MVRLNLVQTLKVLLFVSWLFLPFSSSVQGFEPGDDLSDVGVDAVMPQNADSNRWMDDAGDEDDLEDDHVGGEEENLGDEAEETLDELSVVEDVDDAMGETVEETEDGVGEAVDETDDEEGEIDDVMSKIGKRTENGAGEAVDEAVREMEDAVIEKGDEAGEPADDEDKERAKETAKEEQEGRPLDFVEIRNDVVRNKTHTGDYHHPFYKPDIINDIHNTYRRFGKMKLIRHGSFWMGTNDPKSETGEYPLREVTVHESFYIDIYPVINAYYWAFRARKRFVRSEAEVKGWSWVVEAFVSPETRKAYSTSGPGGWLAVKKARWDRPEGPDSSLEDRWTHPVVHLSWTDAKRYCEFHGKRLPSEQEWEYAARSGLVAEEYPWGDKWQRRRANTWQGKWPKVNTEADGYRSTSPVDYYRPQNLLGLYDMIGNVWEWCHSRYYERLISRNLQAQMHVLKGGSHVDSVDGEHNLAVRNGQRMGQSPDYTASNVGFRCVRSAPEVERRQKPKKTPKPPPSDLKKRKVPKIYRKPKQEVKVKDEL